MAELKPGVHLEPLEKAFDPLVELVDDLLDDGTRRLDVGRATSQRGCDDDHDSVHDRRGGRSYCR